ncbi:hypothetical protein RRG08_029340 [Elysia crispata]|uniref:Uncharacterized protein n=1 Tax=Elysia crispata TaxID=231223 RepID=A0AAE1E4Q2_9GAST|nr:hypothetical protein RRG08_029340 [Elysia crispata]
MKSIPSTYENVQELCFLSACYRPEGFGALDELQTINWITRDKPQIRKSKVAMFPPVCRSQTWSRCQRMVHQCQVWTGNENNIWPGRGRALSPGGGRQFLFGLTAADTHSHLVIVCSMVYRRKVRGIVGIAVAGEKAESDEHYQRGFQDGENMRNYAKRRRRITVQ